MVGIDLGVAFERAKVAVYKFFYLFLTDAFSAKMGILQTFFDPCIDRKRFEEI